MVNVAVQTIKLSSEVYVFIRFLTNTRDRNPWIFRMKKSGDPEMPGIGCQRFVFAKAITWIWVAKFSIQKMPSLGR